MKKILLILTVFLALLAVSIAYYYLLDRYFSKSLFNGFILPVGIVIISFIALFYKLYFDVDNKTKSIFILIGLTAVTTVIWCWIDLIAIMGLMGGGAGP